MPSWDCFAFNYGGGYESGVSREVLARKRRSEGRMVPGVAISS